MGALATAVTSGKALYVGISNYNPEQTLAAHKALAEHKIPLLIHQPRYNMFDRHIEDGLFPVLDELGMGSIVFSPLAQGLLTDRYLHGVPADSRAAEGRWMTREHDRRDLPRAGARPERDREGPRPEPRPARPELGASPAAGHLGPHRRKQRRPAREQPRRARRLPRSRADEIAAIEPFAVHGTGSH